MNEKPTLKNYVPSHDDIVNTCLSYRHDYGLMDLEEQHNLEFEATEWLRAWGHTLSNKDNTNEG